MLLQIYSIHYQKVVILPPDSQIHSVTSEFKINKHNGYQKMGQIVNTTVLQLVVEQYQ